MEDKLAIISVTYQNYPLLEDFFTSLKKQKNKNFHVFMIDNSLEKETINTKGVPTTVIESKNLGYAYGVNQGIKKAKTLGYVNLCIINNDVLFKETFVDDALKTLKKHPHTLIGGKIYYASGYEYHKSKYKKNDLGNVLWFAGGYIDWDQALPKHRGVDEVDKGQFEKIERTDFITGCLMLFDKTVLEHVGLIDEKYVFYFEDADFCERAKRKGIKLLYDPSVSIWHKVSQSTGGSGSQIQRKYQSRNIVIFGLRYAPLRTKLHLVKNYIFGLLKP